MGLDSSNAKPGQALPTTSVVEQTCDSKLENLPSEIRRQILAASDLHCLRALIRASPVFHQQYLLDRKFLLAASIDVTLGSGGIDAYAVQKLDNDGSNSADRVTRILENWQMNIRQRPFWRLQLAGTFTDDEVSSMASFYFRIIVPMAKYFASWASEQFATQIPEFKEHDLGKIEWQRFCRAIYRFQMLCHVACPHSSRAASDNATYLIHTLEPWEAEELYSFYQFAEGIYDKIFDRISGDLHPENPRFSDQDRPLTPDGAFEFDNSCTELFLMFSPPIMVLIIAILFKLTNLCLIGTRRNFAEGTTLRGGLNLLQTVLFDLAGQHDQERLVETMQQSIVSSYIPISATEGIFGEMQQLQRRQQEPSLGDSMTEERAPCPFGGSDLTTPPLAWTVIWGGTYSNLYGYYTCDEFRRWAYVFWDGDRLRRYGAEEVLVMQWKYYWDEDPRETIY